MTYSIYIISCYMVTGFAFCYQILKSIMTRKTVLHEIEEYLNSSCDI